MPLTFSWEPAPPSPQGPTEPSPRADRVAAFFDFDGTLLRGAIGGYVFVEMRRQGMIPRRKLITASAYRVLWWLNLANGADLYRFGYRLLEGMPLEEANALTDRAMERVYRNVFAEGIESLDEHRSQGHLIAAVTGAPEYGAYLLCRRLGIEHLVCTPTPVAGGRLGSEVDRGAMCYGEGKVRRLMAFARAWGVDLARSYAYADSASDAPFLRTVGNPRAVNPHWLLAREARRRGWPVLRFERRAGDGAVGGR